MKKVWTLEENFDKLESVISQMESGGIGLDEAFRLYNEGIKLVKNCNMQLDKVEKQIVVLNSDNLNDNINADSVSLDKFIPENGEDSDNGI